MSYQIYIYQTQMIVLHVENVKFHFIYLSGDFILKLKTYRRNKSLLIHYHFST